MVFESYSATKSRTTYAKSALVALAGLATATSTAWPFQSYFVTGQPVWWLQFLGLSALCSALIQSRSARDASRSGLIFSTMWLVATFWWLFVAMHTYGGLHGVLSVLAVGLLALALSVYYAAACAIFWHRRGANAALNSLTFAALWTLAELARGVWLTGFGWGAIGYAHVDGPLAWYIPWVGAYGVCAIAAWCAMSLAQYRKAGIASVIAAILVAAVPAVAPTVVNEWSSSTGVVSLSLLQGNVPQDEKFEKGSGIPLALEWYGKELKTATGDLVVAPETALPLLPQQMPDGYLAEIVKHFASHQQAALIGVPLGNYREGYTNSVWGLSAEQTKPWQYDKHHLVPFGEFIPPLFKWFTNLMNIPLGDFNRGALAQAPYIFKSQRLALNICYEDLFGEELGARFADAKSSPTIFVNVSNIAWFGDTVAIDQHLQISRMRALEFQRPFVRATNTGATVVLDHRGQVIAELPRYTRGVLNATVEGRTGDTPYAWWVSRFGLWPIWIIALSVLVWVRQRRRPIAQTR